MIILGIETSCDETAVSLIETSNKDKSNLLEFKVLGNELISQIKIHEKYGGVFPMMAKREHGKNLIPLLFKTIKELNSIPNFQFPISNEIPDSKIQILNSILEREPELKEAFIKNILNLTKPPIDAIAVTQGPGLEPALWVGINFAKALSTIWDIPIIPVNHMEGHIISALLKEQRISNFQFPILNEKEKKILNENPNKTSDSDVTSYTLQVTPLPALALLISGGHTELVLIKNWNEYEIIGKTRDDAVGEAFDKVARILGLPYPGGPQISALAEKMRYHSKDKNEINLPRPMINSGNLDFSFSGLKTAVLYMVKKIPDLTENIKEKIALEFEDAVTEVLISKTKKAIEEYGAQSVILGGGVTANKHIRESFDSLAKEMSVSIHIPSSALTTDNALMIAISGTLHLIRNTSTNRDIKAKGNLALN